MPAMPRKKSDNSPVPVSAPIIDQGVPASEEPPVPRWLLCVYYILPIAGLVFLYAFWDGSFGWFDRGAWSALQQVANTK